MNARWIYKVVELKPTFLGLKAATVQDALNQLGAQGWELVSVLNQGMTLRLYLKRQP